MLKQLLALVLIICVGFAAAPAAKACMGMEDCPNMEDCMVKGCVKCDISPAIVSQRVFAAETHIAMRIAGVNITMPPFSPELHSPPPKNA